MNKQVEELIKAYQNAQQSLVKTIATKQAKGNMTAYQKSLLAQVNNELIKLTKYAKEWTNNTVPKTYYDALQETAVALNVEYASYMKSFSKLHTEAVKTLIENTYKKLEDANNFLGRRIADAVRQAGVNAILNKTLTGQTVVECKKNIVNSLIDKGFTGVQDKRGRNIPLAAYADIVARGTLAESQNLACTNQMKSLDRDLVKMSEHNTTCSICGMYQGRVYSISGKDDRFPYLYDVPGFKAGYNNIHPRCAHRVAPYIEAFNDVSKDMAISNKPFELSPKDEKALKEYNRVQEAKAQQNSDRKQWQNYLLAMPGDTPKTFAAFRRMKYSNSGKYDDLQSNYKSLRQGGEGN